MQQNEISTSAFELERWVDDYSQILLDRAYYMLSDKEDAKDVVQEVFFSAYKSRDSFQGKSSPLTWLTSILHHKVAGEKICNCRFKEDEVEQFKVDLKEKITG